MKAGKPERKEEKWWEGSVVGMVDIGLSRPQYALGESLI
jgi:hypothetical protein